MGNKYDYNQKIKRGQVLFPKGWKNQTEEQRKEAAYKGTIQQAPDWKDNEWFRKAFDDAWAKDTSAVKSTHMGYRRKHVPADPEWQEHQAHSVVTGYKTYDRKSYNTLAHSLAGSAQKMWTADTKKQAEEKKAAREKSAKMARGGTGSRRKTMLTGGRGLTGNGPAIEKKSLLGRGRS